MFWQQYSGAEEKSQQGENPVKKHLLGIVILKNSAAGKFLLKVLLFCAMIGECERNSKEVFIPWVIEGIC